MSERYVVISADCHGGGTWDEFREYLDGVVGEARPGDLAHRRVDVVMLQMGLVGLFLGAVVLAVGFALSTTWLSEAEEAGDL